MAIKLPQKLKNLAMNAYWWCRIGFHGITWPIAAITQTQNQYVTLRLTNKQAQWLKSKVQNPISIGDPNRESIENQTIRHEISMLLEHVKF